MSADDDLDPKLTFERAFHEFLGKIKESAVFKHDPQVWLTELKDDSMFFQLTANFVFKGKKHDHRSNISTNPNGIA